MAPEQNGIELRKYLEVVTRGWWILLTIAVIGCALAYYQANRQVRMYRASAEVLVQEARSGLIGPGDIGTNTQLAITYARLATTRDLVSRVEQELGLSRSPTVKAAGNGSILRISAEDPDPLVARDVANKLPEVLILDIQTNSLMEIGRLETLAKTQGVSVNREVLQARLSTLHSLRVIEPAATPGQPFAPKPGRNAVFGGMLGLMLGGLIIFVLEHFNNNIRSVEQLEKLAGTSQVTSSALGVIFRWNHKETEGSDLVVRDQPTSPYAEMFRQLRTGFQFARAVNDSKTFLITSASSAEGKTTIAANLAVVLAQGGSRVILVEAELRRPATHHLFNLPGPSGENNHQGLSGLLINSTRPAATELLDVGIPGLKVIPSGRVPPNPADLIASSRAKAIFDELKGQCDILLLDSPPIMAAADPMILAGYVDGVILVVTMGQTRTDIFQNAVAHIQRPGTPIIGYVLNKVKPQRRGYGYYQYYYHYPSLDEAGHTDGARPRRPGTNGIVSLLHRVVDQVKNSSRRRG